MISIVMEPELLKQQSEEIEGLLAQAKQHLTELNELKESATHIRSVIKGRETEVNNRTGEINELKGRADQLETEINKTVQAAVAKANEISEYYQKFSELKEKVDNEDEGVSALLAEVEAYRTDAAAVKKDADNQLVDIKGRGNEVEDIRLKAESSKNEIEELAENSKSLRDSIHEHLELIDASVLRNEFKKREKALLWFVIAWGIVGIFSLGGFAGGLLYVFSKLAANSFIGWHEWYRLLFTTPALVLFFIAFRNYSQERKLLERYAFKAVISTSLTSYIKLLTDRFNDEETILTFTKEALQKIYREPFEEVETKSRGYISLWNVVRAEVELDERVKDQLNKNIEKKIDQEIKNPD